MEVYTMKKINIIMLTLTLIGTMVAASIPVLGIIEALAYGPMSETYPAVVMFGLFELLGLTAIIHVIYEIWMEVNKEEA